MSVTVESRPGEPLSDPGKQGRLASGIAVVPAFDGFRAYAIMAVVALHLLVYSGLLAARGQDWFVKVVGATLGQAIDVLFIVSGFVVFLPTVARGGRFGSVRSYAIRRAARLGPAYWLILALVLVLIALVPLVPPLGLPSAESLAIHALFLQAPVQMVEAVPIGFGVNGVVWTLSLEVAFYVLLPLVAGWYFRHPLLGLAAAAALTAVWHEAFLHFGAITDLIGLDVAPATAATLQFSAVVQFPFYAFSFAAGMTAAWVYVRVRERGSEAPRRAGRLLVLALAGLACFAYLLSSEAEGFSGGRQSSLVAIGFSGSLAASMLLIALGRPVVQKPFSNSPMRSLGDISYGIFLVHMVILTYALQALGAGERASLEGLLEHGSLVIGDGTISQLLVLTAIVVPLSMLYGWASARFLEQPIRRWARRYGRRGESAST